MAMQEENCSLQQVSPWVNCLAVLSLGKSATLNSLTQCSKSGENAKAKQLALLAACSSLCAHSQSSLFSACYRTRIPTG